jgi:3-hydroxybutyryl-CoA dehydrogenase
MRAVERIGVLGAGVMGSGIAQVAATAGYDTVCYDVDAGALDRGQEHVTTGRYGLERGVERGRPTRRWRASRSRDRSTTRRRPTSWSRPCPNASS